MGLQVPEELGGHGQGLLGLAMIVWALPRLARRFGVPPVSALWLGAANPLVLFHLVVGVHNEGLAIGLMLVGLELALRKMPVTPGSARTSSWSGGSCSRPLMKRSA